ncbi:magnesium transporter [Deinococcus terrestris]|uniref:magnesium transporter n=1 Tax=Deinococcus terrestris TaxID=2651870 RepID=UPI003899493B
MAAPCPLVLRRLQLNPAVVSVPRITTVVDGTGLAIHLLVAGAVPGLWLTSPP